MVADGFAPAAPRPGQRGAERMAPARWDATGPVAGWAAGADVPAGASAEPASGTAAPRFMANPDLPANGAPAGGADDETFPLPVILPERPPVRPAERVEPPGPPPAAESADSRVRGPFEAYEQGRSGSAEAGEGTPAAPLRHAPAEPGPPDVTPPAVIGADSEAGTLAPESSAVAKTDKMERIKDLYLTAEAIGDDALAQYFQQVSERQRQLIREYFDEPVADAAEGQPPA